MQPQWWVSKDGDLDCHELYMRHYSAHRYLDDRRERDKRFSGPGEKLVLRTAAADAMFVWRRFVDDCIDQRTGERQSGVNCAVFRNEGQYLSSDLIRQADAIADATWADSRHYTYVGGQAVKSANPGYCFLKAGWRRCGMTKGGLIVMERLQAHDGDGSPSSYLERPSDPDLNPVSVKDLSASASPATKEQQ